MVNEVLVEARIEIAQLQGIAYGAGPGSFTGLRIAAGVTQGLALARGIGVIGVGSLLALSEEGGKDAAGGRMIACLDAHMGEVYHAAYRRAGAGWEEVSAPGLYRPEAVPVAPGRDWTGRGSEGRRHGGAGVSARQGRAQDERTLMSAVLRPAPSLEPMSEADLRAVIEIEEGLYEFPWTLGNFRDSLRAGYGCWTYRDDGGQLIGYAVLMLAAGEAHLLNLSVAAGAQRRGHGRSLLAHVVAIAREHEAKVLFLEVRPTNEVGRRLYAGYGFNQVGVRRGYYPARRGREDALVLALDL